MERKAGIGLMQLMMKIMLNVFQHGSEKNFWFCHWIAESEDLIHKKLEDLKGDKLFYTLAQEMKSFITFTEPDKDFITE